MQGLLFIVAAPSGAGKSSLVNAVLAEDPRLRLSISYTTRVPRPGEVNGREYHFVDRETFLSMAAAGDFLESAEVHGNFYATSQRQIDEIRAGGRDALLEIDWQGAQQVRRLYADAVGIFILPPSLEALRDRLIARGQDSEAVIRQRLAAAEEEMSHAPEFDYVIINKDFDEAQRDLAAVVRASRLSLERQSVRHPELFRPRKPA
ncbi:MAG TPA: guanylate kinase [Burkholderiales bacterium]|jgi:guanylate kinase|nr:guanylate kinase [Burkholderiales bacterium]